jgi:hypothetical protein
MRADRFYTPPGAFIVLGEPPRRLDDGPLTDGQLALLDTPPESDSEAKNEASDSST